MTMLVRAAVWPTCWRCWGFLIAVVFVVGVLITWSVRRVEQRRSRFHYAAGLAYIELAAKADEPDLGEHLVVAFDPRFADMRDRTLAAHRGDGG